MSVIPRSVAGAAIAAAIGGAALFALPAAGFASDAADAETAIESGSGADDHAPLAHHRRARLTDEQRACLEEQGIERPDGRPSAEERDALREEMRAAAEACDIDLPEPLLTDEQRACLEEQGIERPETRPDREERAALREQMRAAAEECGIDLPLRDGRGPGCWRDGDADDGADPSDTADPAVLPAA